MDSKPLGFMEQVVHLARENVQVGGGPFAALVVREGVIIAAAGNRVTQDNDPTAHAEVVAIRLACRELQHYQLQGCTVYASCEPCPMCLAALYWARPDAVYYAASRHDAAVAGFDDAYIYDELAMPDDKKKLRISRIEIPNASDPFQAWERFESRRTY